MAQDEKQRANNYHSDSAIAKFFARFKVCKINRGLHDSISSNFLQNLPISLTVKNVACLYCTSVAVKTL